MMQRLTTFADTHFIPWWRQSWRDGSTIAITALSAVATILAENSATLLGITRFIPDGPLRLAALAGIFLSLFIPSLLAKLWKQPRPGVDLNAPTGPTPGIDT